MPMGRRLPSSRLEVWLTGILNSLSISKQSQQFISAVSSSSEGSRFGRILVLARRILAGVPGVRQEHATQHGAIRR